MPSAHKRARAPLILTRSSAKKRSGIDLDPYTVNFSEITLQPAHAALVIILLFVGIGGILL